jgi:hypothetical protein
VRQALVTVLTVAFLAGCGGSGGSSKPLSKAEYASKADAVCAKYNKQVKELKNPSNLSELAEIADKTLPILDNAISDLKKLKPPADEQSIAAQWLVQVQGLKNDLQEIRDKANAKDIQAVQQVVPKAEQHNARSNELATELGMTVCNSD